MRAILKSLTLTLAMGLLGSSLQGQCCYIMPPPAPDMRGPGFYWTSPYGDTYGPSWYVQPPFPPFQGMIPGPKPGNGGGGTFPGFPSHLYARSPRDYFMIDFNPATNPYSYGGTSPLYPTDRGGFAAPR